MSTIANKVSGGVWYTNHLFTDNEDGSLELTSGKIHCNHAYTKDMFIRVGAYNNKPDLSFDFVLINALRGAIQLQPDMITPSYIYRKKSTSTQNHSALYQADLNKQHEEYAKVNSDFEKGDIELNPHWSRNWQKLADEAIARNPVPIPLHVADKSYKAPIEFHKQLDNTATKM
jgi:hypothetical protein